VKVGVTGIDGFLGWHLRVYLHGDPDVTVIGANRGTFADHDQLAKFVGGCDAIVHLAGMNRGEDAEIERTNANLAELLIAACERQKCRPHILFASSAHINRDTVYGRSKRDVAEKFSRWAERSGCRFTNLILPNVFGECGRPFYNSAVSTFCYQLANDQKPEILKDVEYEIIHAQLVARTILDFIRDSKCGSHAIAGTQTSVSGVLRSVTDMAELYRKQCVPDLSDSFQLALFNTFRSYLYPNRFPVVLTLHEDKRGSLFEAVKTRHGGQAFLSHTHPGITRGNHYHKEKFERFLVLRGEATIRIRKMFAENVFEFKTSGDKPQYVDIPTLHTHNITNTGDTELTTMFWSHQIFDPSASDTVAETV
jgi:UDP-2-acetamido-2,6-beta-L-arabino-hexul-4-ose reductase